MHEVRLVTTVLDVAFDKGKSSEDGLIKEYYSLMKINDDPLGMWLKSPKIRKASEQSDQVLLTLLIELHRKMDAITRQLNNENEKQVTLMQKAKIVAIGHGYFQLDTPLLEVGEDYYARIDMPLFPRRNVPLFFSAQSETLAKIDLMHEDDEDEWGSYMVACERAMIRQMKGNLSEY